MERGCVSDHLAVCDISATGTGIFRVAAQDLPVFEWHYRLSYILLFLTIQHVWLHWRTVTAWVSDSSAASGRSWMARWRDGEMASLLALDPEIEPVLYITAVGR